MQYLRDTIYSARNSSKGALIEEAGKIFSALNEGLSLPEIRTLTMKGSLLSQRAWNTRKRIWTALHYRYFTHHIDWVIEDIKKACINGQESREFISMLYLHYVLRDKVTYDFITQILWQKWCEGKKIVSPEEILYLLDNLSAEYQQIKKWAEKSRKKLAVSILSALRDFGILSGKYKKTILQPVLPLFTAAHLLRILTFEGHLGREILKDPTWKIFLSTEQDISHVLTKLSQTNLIHYEKTGNTVVLQTPEEWRKKDE
ncbi:MAG TPA: DUF1819 family protein [Candidatus Eremiobacteraeota bacterium]|nr:DUF1819 family protein [Candidatus Eremiobacteraeota bacterium]